MGSFYGATYCVGCSKHLPVDEFIWAEFNELTERDEPGARVGS